MDVLQICARFFIPVFIVKSLHASVIKINLLGHSMNGCQNVPFINDWSITELDTFQIWIYARFLLPVFPWNHCGQCFKNNSSLCEQLGIGVSEKSEELRIKGGRIINFKAQPKIEAIISVSALRNTRKYGCLWWLIFSTIVDGRLCIWELFGMTSIQDDMIHGS